MEPAPAGGLTFQPDLGLPASEVTMIGASPAETEGEVWAEGNIASAPALVKGQQLTGPVLLHHASGTGWQILAFPTADAQGAPLNFPLLLANDPPVLAAQTTAMGGIALLRNDSSSRQLLLTRNPGGALQAASLPQPPVLEAGERLWNGTTDPAMAPIDETGHVGVLVAPTGQSPGRLGVLRYDGTRWSREHVLLSPGGEAISGFTALAIAAGAAAGDASRSSPENAWMLASSNSRALMIFRREPTENGEFAWHQVTVAGGSLLDTSPAGGAPRLEARATGEVLTVTSQGLWVDGQIAVSGGAPISTSIFLTPSAAPATDAQASPASTWCYPSGPLCEHSLGASLPDGDYRSIAWPGGGAGDFGTRIITGLPAGALLELNHTGDFSYTVGSGGPTTAAAAFTSPQEGWLTDRTSPENPLIHVTTAPEPDRLQSEPAPFRRPLTAIASQPGAAVGGAGSQALAVGDNGEVARYVPGEGWRPEYLYTASGGVATPRLRGVAWPEPDRAYAVGDKGAMWLWNGLSGTWVPDPATPYNFRANLNAVAFSASHPQLGYAVGKQGTLLQYGKSWSQVALPPGLEDANFTSIAFAGSEALATYRIVAPNSTEETGGLLVDEGSGWQVDPTAVAAMASLPSTATMLSRVAGLPDGGAVAAGPDVVLERDSASSAWRLSTDPLPDAQNISALAAFREGPTVRALVSIDTNVDSSPNGLVFTSLDQPTDTQPGEPAPYVGPDPLPVTGMLLRETPAGWQDEEHQSFPFAGSTTAPGLDLPLQPDAVLALLLDPEGQQGWAVGGQTGGILADPTSAKAIQTAGIERYPASGTAAPASVTAPVSTPAAQATFAVGGNAQCADATCAEDAGGDLGPDRWLPAALTLSSRIAQTSGGGLRAFLYTGARIGAPSGSEPLGEEEFQRGLSRYATLLHTDDAVPVYPASSPSELAPAGQSGPSAGIGPFCTMLIPGCGGETSSPWPTPPPTSAAYSFDSSGPGGTVRVIVLDYSQSRLDGHDGTLAPGTPCASLSSEVFPQLAWLCRSLEVAKAVHEPAIVMGNADLTGPCVEGAAESHAHVAADTTVVAPILMEGGASAYFFDSAGQNVSCEVGSGPSAVPAFGTGTLGYTPVPQPTSLADLSASGFLLASVNVQERNPLTNRAPVSVRLIPNIAELALDAQDGTLLRRSQPALFNALARRPEGGLRATPSTSVGYPGQLGDQGSPDPYEPIPSSCAGASCAALIEPEYSFSSSAPDIGNFVSHNPGSSNPHAILLDSAGNPIADPTSGLFCAFNAGTTTVTITTGGLAYSEQITVQPGSVERPCGTVPLINPPPAVAASVTATSAPPPPPPAPAPISPVSTPSTPPSVPAPLPAAIVHHHHPPRPTFVPPPPLLVQTPFAFAPRAIVAPSPPSPARPVPPSGTSTIEAVEEKREEQSAPDMVVNMSAYHPAEHGVPPLAWLTLIVIAAGAGTGVRRGRSRRGAAAHAWCSPNRRAR